MARGESSDAWSIWEELLLVCAARLHGHESWDKIAIEVQYKSQRSERFFTPRTCIAKFRYLHHQIIGGTVDVDDQTLDSMVEVLRKRRIAELTREIESLNKNIGLLEQNLERLSKGKAKSHTDEAEEDEGRRRRLSSAKVESHCQKIMKRVLRKLQRQKYSSLFERRLPSQKTEEYRKTILQHMDLETIQSRVNQDEYQRCFKEFFFDLLLLVNNAIIFFGKNSEEHLAALQLRDLVRTEMDKIVRNPFLGRDQIFSKDVPRGRRDLLVIALNAKNQ